MKWFGQSGSAGSRREADDEAPACAEFEATTRLMDGALSGDAHAAAVDHAQACDVCGPMVADWPMLSEALSDRFEDAAELAKPRLAALPSRVTVAIAARERPTRSPLFSRPILRYPAVAAMGTAAAVLLAWRMPRVTPTAPLAPRAPTVHVIAPVVAVAAPAPAPEPTDPNDCHWHQLIFNGADGMVYRTETDGMTVIWVNEHDDA